MPGCCYQHVLAKLTQSFAPTDRFALLIEGLCRAVALRIAGGALAGPLIILISCRLRRMAMRFARLAERLRTGARAGTAGRRRAVSPRPAGHSPQGPAKHLPRNFAWLPRLVPAAGAAGSQLQHLLADPEMAALIVAAPQAGRILRPLCRMLGVRPPPVLARPARPRQPAPPLPVTPADTIRAQAPPAATPPAPAPPRQPTRTWLRRTSLPGRRRPMLIATRT